MVKKIETDILIAGAGLTGLTAAFYLKKNGFNVCILEESSRVGGVIQTHSENGFIFESGPNTGALSNPEIVELFEDLNGQCELEIANPEAKKRLIWKNDKWNALPSGPLSAIGTPLFSVKDKFRILGEPWRKKGSNPYESVAELVKRRLGESYLEYAVDPFVSGIYAGDPEKLITKYALPKLYNLEQNYGSFIGGAIKKRKEPKDERTKKVSREVFSSKQGLSNLTEALANSIGQDKIHLNATEIRIVPDGKRYLATGKIKEENIKVSSRFVVTTCRADKLSFLVPFVKDVELQAIENLIYAKLSQVILGFKNWQGIALDAFGGLVPSKEKKNILGVLFTSSFFNERAPEGGALLSIFAGGMRHPEMFSYSDEQLLDLIFNDVKEMLQLREINADLTKIFRYEFAIPQYQKSSEERLDAISRIENQYPGLYLAGGIRDGVGMPDRVKQARDLANLINNG